MTEIKYAIGVDLGGTSVKAGIVSSEGDIVEKTSVETFASEGPERVISQIQVTIERMLERKEYEIAGIGIGAPGMVHLEKGVVEHPPNIPGWTSIPLGSLIEERYKTETHVENDANAAAIGELIYGAGKGYGNFIMITLGTGVGGGIIINNKLLRGETGAAGELGHISIDYNGKKCNCGRRRCIEAYLGNNYLIQDVQTVMELNPDSILYRKVKIENKELTPKLIHEASSSGCNFAQEIIVEAGKKLGYAIATTVNLFDISRFIVGGGVAGFGELLFNSIRSAASERALKPFKERLDIVPAELKNEAGIKGASSLVFYNH